MQKTTKLLAAVVLFLSLYINTCLAVLGVDISQPAGTEAWRCLKNSGYTFGVVRCYESVGRIDPNAVGSVASAWAGGMTHVDVYMFPCPKCGNPQAQVREAVDNLKSHNTNFGMLWFDIEGPQYWTSSVTTNREFFTGLVDEAKSLGVKIGVYSSESQWIPIFGNWAGGASLPLWYAHYDDVPSFGDFSPFAGWSRPSIKQFAGTTSICGIGVDKDWYP
eukprot:TRINITY_DN3737_c1_g1_i1.p1 TRINITY_DN3737_c1_g1~~TRINITY_DN3737_c1_g1_i1.p1  ORF type:complete len:229 (+),score=39.59 TRINITY_DN3737_c1_g1_i1:31-687(+)